MKRIILIVLALALTFSLSAPAMAVTPSADAASNLNKLGLFQGVGENSDGTPNFDLQRAPTRAEAVTMLVRLLGKEQAAQGGTWQTPFVDVPDWAKPYVGYAFENKLTNGISEDAFGSDMLVAASQYITFVLRALGYADGEDFSWDKAWELSDRLGFTDGSYSPDAASILRAGLASISYDALTVAHKGSARLLYETLMEQRVFTEEMAIAAGLKKAVEDGVTLSSSAITVDVGKTASLTATVSPSDAANKTITWSSSDASVARVENGVISGVKAGNAVITARTHNGKTATCAVTVKAASKFVVPQLGHDYGPMKLTTYYSHGGHWYYVQFDSFVFTKCAETSIDKYDISISVQGISDSSLASFYVYFYDANNRVLEEVYMSVNGTPNQSFNKAINTYIDYSTIDNAVRMEFYSYSGDAADTTRGSEPTQPTQPTPPTQPTEPTQPTNPNPNITMYSADPRVPDFGVSSGAGYASRTINPNYANSYTYTYMLTGVAAAEEEYHSLLEQLGYTTSSDSKLVWTSADGKVVLVIASLPESQYMPGTMIIRIDYV